MAPAFGTSGLRGLVVDLTDPVVAKYTRAFLRSCDCGGGQNAVLYLGQDLRASSRRIAGAVRAAAQEMGVRVVDCGALPTPALALAAAGAGAIMVTGSHIPDNRNGLKFYTRAGEITKQDEAAILAARDAFAKQDQTQNPAMFDVQPAVLNTGANPYAQAYIQRYAAVFGPKALAGLRLGIYQHSSVARDILVNLARALGADAVPLGHADHFIPIDTEAVDADTRAQLAAWAQAHHLDAIWSSDGDGDRPLLTDAAGQVIAGDVLGVLTARALGAQVICTPVSCNSMIEDVPEFDRVVRCKIGSPYVIAAMQAALAADPAARVVGFEANGGFLLGFEAGVTQHGPAADGMIIPRHAPLPALFTRDAALPLIAPLAAARAMGQSLTQTRAALPPRATAADRLQNIPQADSAALLAQLMIPQTRTLYLTAIDPSAGQVLAEDHTDGLRLSLQNNQTLHIRPSGNAPELRLYAEARTESAAQALLASAIAQTRIALDTITAQDTNLLEQHTSRKDKT